MLKISPLLSLTDFDEEEFKRGAIRHHPPIQGPSGEYFGHEWSRWRHDSFDAAVDRWLAARARTCVILDIGGATGVRAAEFAEAGHQVMAVDVVDLPDRRTALGLTFLHADVRTLAAEQFATPCDLIHARRVLNFLSLDDLDRFFAFSRAVLTPDGLLAFSLFTLDVLPERMQGRLPRGSQPPLPLAPGLLAHHLTEVHGLMHDQGLRIIEAFSDRRVEVDVIAACRATRRRPD